jgi:hypothetical protein
MVTGLLERLQGRAAERMQRAYAPKSKGPLQSAIRKLARFAREVPERELFRQSRFQGDREAAAWNEWTLILFVEWLTEAISQKTKKPVQVSTVESYVSLLKGYLIFEYDFEIRDKAPRLTRLITLLRMEDPLAGVRRKRRGFRRRHLRKLWKLCADVRAETPDAVNRIAALGTAWHVLARGGEICPGAFDAERYPSRADLEFHRATDGCRYVVLWLRPLKKRGSGIQPKVPQYIAEANGGGSDVYMLLRRMVDMDAVPEAAKATTPLFRVAKKRGQAPQAMSVAQLRAFTRNCATRLGYPVRSHWGAHSGRIGGATDLASTGRASQLLLQAKGRWASDIGRIYARMTRRSQLAASSLMQKARGRDLEELFPRFAQGA